MDSRFLETFIVVADCGSIAEAARRLNKTPAALAQRLRALEDDLGHTLITRVGRTVQPTAAGLAILHEARNLVQGVRDLRAIAANGIPAGQLRLGATSTSLIGLLPPVVAELSAAYPDLEYFVRPGSSVDLYHDLVAGELDAAFMVRPAFQIPKSTNWMTMRDEPLILLAPADAPALPAAELLARYRFIRYDRNQWGGQIVERYLKEREIAAREWLELDALDAIAALVDRGLGVSIVPDWGPPWPEGLNFKKLRLEGSEGRETGLLWRNSGARLAAVNALCQACRTVAAQARPASQASAPVEPESARASTRGTHGAGDFRSEIPPHMFG